MKQKRDTDFEQKLVSKSLTKSSPWPRPKVAPGHGAMLLIDAAQCCLAGGPQMSKREISKPPHPRLSDDGFVETGLSLGRVLQTPHWTPSGPLPFKAVTPIREPHGPNTMFPPLPFQTSPFQLKKKPFAVPGMWPFASIRRPVILLRF